jgi:peptide/nickel transport system ATP-binding protein
LLACTLDPRRPSVDLRGIPGAPPDPAHPLPGCAFHPRCASAGRVPGARCQRERPPLVLVGAEHARACHLDVPEARS